MLRIMVLIPVIAGITACTHVRNKKEIADTSSTIYMKIEKPDIASLTPLRLSEFVDQVEYVQLETTPQCLLHQSISLYPTRDFFFIVSKYGLYQFDTAGKFVRQIGRLGKGPGEFKLKQCGFDDTNRRIIIISYFGTGPQFFGYNGKFQGNLSDSLISSCHGMLELFRVGNGFFIYTVQPSDINHQWACQPYELVVYDYLKNKTTQTLTNRLVCQVDNDRHYNSLRPSLQTLTGHDSLFYYKSFYNDTLYSVSNSNIQPYAVIDFGNLKYPDNALYSPGDKMENESIGKMRITEIQVQKECILMNVLLHKAGGKADSFVCKYDIATKNLTYHSALLLNDIDGGQNIGISSLVKGITTVRFPDEFKEKIDKERLFSTLDKADLKRPELKEILELIQQNRKEEDNPAVMLLYLK